MTRFFGTAAIVLSFATGHVAQAKVYVDKGLLTDFAYGIVCNVGGPAVTAPGTTAGKRIATAGLPFVAKTTTKVPALKGVSFGVMARGIGPDILRRAATTMTHPPFIGSSGTKERTKTDFGPPAPSFSGYTFDVDKELVPGLWVAQADWNGKVLYRVEFEVVEAASMPGFKNPCP